MEQTAGGAATTGGENSSKLEHTRTEFSTGSFFEDELSLAEVLEQQASPTRPQGDAKRPNSAVTSQPKGVLSPPPAHKQQNQQQPQQQPRPAKRTRRERGSASRDRVSKIPPPVAGKRSSMYRGVTRHRWTGRYEAHLWDKSTWNQNQNKKGKQVYLGAYDDEEAAARAYDLAALKYWGVGTVINFPVSEYARDVDEMAGVSREEYLASLRRKSSGFSRGVSKYRGVARHHHNGRWEARIGRVFGNKYLYLGTYGTQEEAAAAYDMAAIEYRGLNAVTNFDLSRYIKWLRPGQAGAQGHAHLQGLEAAAADEQPQAQPGASGGGLGGGMDPESEDHHGHHQQQQQQQQQQGLLHMWGAPHQPRCQQDVGDDVPLDAYAFPSLHDDDDSALCTVSSGEHADLGAVAAAAAAAAAAPTALGLLWQSNVFKQMLEKASAHAGSCDDGVPMTGIFPGLDDESRLSYEDASCLSVDDLPLPSPLPFSTSGSFSQSSPGFAEAQEVWNSLANALPLRSPISV